MPKPKIITIVGPTASGKTSLSIEIAKHFNGEVISADSRQVYKGMDIGSGKVTKSEMQGIPHHLLNIAEPMTVYNGTDFVRDAKVAIADIASRKKNPIIAGGTFFYTDLLRGNLSSAPVPPNESLRNELEKLDTEKLFVMLKEKDSERADSIDQHNRRRLIRSLEIIDSLGKVPPQQIKESEYEWLVFGIDIPNEILHERIKLRLKDRLENGMIEEVENLLANDIPPERLISFGLEYKYITEYLLKKITYEEMYESIFAKSRQFAKRQKTWLKRDKTIIWKEFPVEISHLEQEIEAFLNT
jgi:tRNA dimethylallyltransferase